MSAQQGGNAGSSTDGAQGSVTPPAFVTPEQLAAMEAKLANDMKAHLGRMSKELQESLAKLSPPQTAESGSAPKGGEFLQQFEALRQQNAALAEKAAKQQRAAIRASLLGAMTDRGADRDLAETAVDSILLRNGDSLKTSENELGETVVSVEAGGKQLGVGEWVDAYLNSDKGKKLVATRRQPAIGQLGGTAATGARVRMTRMEAATADPKLLKSGAIEFVD